MDASSYLRRHGWRGDGHSLDHTGKGIKKPLLVSRKVDVLGVGLSKHTALSDQWWLKAFDSALKDMGTGKQSVLSNLQKHGAKNGDLYGRFVKGEGMAGTIGESDPSSGSPTPVPEAVTARSLASGKRKREDDDQGGSFKAAKLEDGRVDRQVKKLMWKAVRCGIIPPKSKRAGERISSCFKPVEKDKKLHEFITATGYQSHKLSGDAAKPERSRRDFRRAAQAYLSGEPVAPDSQRKEIETGLSRHKLAEYTKRAQHKGLSVESYIKRRTEKRAAKNSSPQVTGGNVGATFIVDPIGDPRLATKKSSTVPADFSKQAIDGITAGELTVITNEAGDELFSWHPGMSIPLDPRIWEGAKVKHLPKPIKKARRAWLAERREGRKAKKSEAQASVKKAKSGRKK